MHLSTIGLISSALLTLSTVMESIQLKMLSTSSFQPLAASMGPMLKEESFHLGTGANGLRRIVKQE